MSIRTRLQSFIDSKQKIQIWYGMGCHNVCTGRVLHVDQDHIDMETYVHDNEGQINIKRLLIPMHLILHIDITTAESTEDPEITIDNTEFLAIQNVRPSQIVKKSQPDYNSNFKDKPSQENLSSQEEITTKSENLSLIPTKDIATKVLTNLDSLSKNKFSRMVISPRGLAFACDNSVWIYENNNLIEYARIRGNSIISGLRFDNHGMLYIATVQGTLYRIDSFKSGRILAQLDVGQYTGAIFLSDLVLDDKDNIYVANFPSNTGGIFKVDLNGNVEKFLSNNNHGTQGLCMIGDNNKRYLWALEHGSGCIVKYDENGQELEKVLIAEPESFNFSDGYDGNLASDDNGNIYVTVGKAGYIVRVDKKLDTQIICQDLSNPTGITIYNDALYVLESGKARILKIESFNSVENKSKANLLNY